MAEDSLDESLQSLFDAAEEKRRALDSSFDTNSPSYRSDLDAALSLYARVLERVSASSLFSLNETLDDVATSALPYLLVHFHVAELLQKTPSPSPTERIAVLLQARAAYERFLSIVDAYGLVRSPYDKLLERYRDAEDPGSFAVVASSDPAQRRNGKIAAFQAEKQLKERIEALRRNPAYVEGGGDDEIVREVHVASVAFAVHTTFHALDTMNRELPLLAQAPSPETPYTISHAQRQQERPRHTTSSASDTRLDNPLNQLRSTFGAGGGPLLSKGGKPLQPFTLVGSRAQLARDTFRPGHNLPTMSVDEYLEEERRRGGIIEGGVEPKTVIDEDDMAASEMETYKARGWDDFKDENPRGAGNTLNMG